MMGLTKKTIEGYEQELITLASNKRKTDNARIQAQSAKKLAEAHMGEVRKEHAHLTKEIYKKVLFMFCLI